MGCVDAYILGLASTRAPVWGRTLRPSRSNINTSSFNSRPIVGANPETAPPVQEDYELQLTPRVGANRQRMPCRFPRRASTHAPRVGANVKNPWHNYEQSELQLTPPCGGAPPEEDTRIAMYRASTHAPAWGRTCNLLAADDHIGPSTHAPSWGRTCSGTLFYIWQALQLTPHRGGELNIWALGADDKMLQFTSPCGANFLVRNLNHNQHRFNSRPCVGANYCWRTNAMRQKNASTHAPCGGRTQI